MPLYYRGVSGFQEISIKGFRRLADVNLEKPLRGKMPQLDPAPYEGRLTKRDKVKISEIIKTILRLCEGECLE